MRSALRRPIASSPTWARTCATWIQNYMFTRSRTIAGGTAEVQRNVIANELLGA